MSPHNFFYFATLISLATSLYGASISGTVTNQATGQFLQDALVEIPQLNRTINTDELGRFSIRDLPLGSYQINISYIDLNPDIQSVTLTEMNPHASLDIQLTSEVYRLETVSVSGEREGSAAALSRQRAADNIKNVVSFC